MTATQEHFKYVQCAQVDTIPPKKTAQIVPPALREHTVQPLQPRLLAHAYPAKVERGLTQLLDHLQVFAGLAFLEPTQV